MFTPELFPVGQFVEEFNAITGQNLPCSVIYQSAGLLAHIRNHHPGTEHLLAHVPAIIKAPDFVGKHPGEDNSVELVKVIDEATMLCIKLDQKNNYLYVASLFTISNSKLHNRISSGRLKPFKSY